MWKDDYLELVFGKNHTTASIIKGTELKNQHIPNLLYKYRTVSKNHINALKNDYLYAVQIDSLNDPFEGAIRFLHDNINSKLNNDIYDNMRSKLSFLPDKPVDTYQDFLENVVLGCGGSLNDLCDPELNILKILNGIVEAKEREELIKLYEMARRSYNICSFSELFDSTLMWAHYADGHHGFCAGYDIKSLDNAITGQTVPVIYRNEMVLISDIKEINGNTNMLALTSKSTDWGYEKEWRILYLPEGVSQKVDMPTPKVVYLGINIEKEKRDIIIDICSKKGIDVYQMKKDDDTNTLKPHQIEASACKTI